MRAETVESASEGRRRSGERQRLAQVFELLAGDDAPVQFRAYDGSRAGSADADVRIEIRSPRAVAYLAWAPGMIGLARAYVSGELDVVGDMHTLLTRVLGLTKPAELTWAERVRIVRALAGLHLLRRPAPPAEEVRINRLPLRGRRHSKRRDLHVVAHHYDVSSRFYELVLGPSMTYSCAYYADQGTTLDEAQSAKHELVARKLGLKPGMRLLDVGCGWGGMVRHVAEHFGVEALGVTLSRAQAEYGQRAIVDAGLRGRAEIRHLDYRDLAEGEFDAISSIGLAEHIGKARLPSYFSSLHGKLRPGGRLLNHCITRPNNLEPARRRTSLTNRYVFPDGELVSPGYLISLMHDAGFEVRHQETLRDHYPPTLAAWCRNLDERWDEAVIEVGAARARVWRLYMALARVGFERNRLQVHQILAVKLDHDGNARMPPRPDWEAPRWR